MRQWLQSKIGQPARVIPEMWGIHKGDRTGRLESCNVYPRMRATHCNSRSSWQPLTPPAALLHLEFQEIQPECWACGLRERLLTIAMTSLPCNKLANESSLVSYPNYIRLRINSVTVREYRGGRNDSAYTHSTYNMGMWLYNGEGTSAMADCGTSFM